MKVGGGVGRKRERENCIKFYYLYKDTIILFLFQCLLSPSFLQIPSSNQVAVTAQEGHSDHSTPPSKKKIIFKISGKHHMQICITNLNFFHLHSDMSSNLSLFYMIQRHTLIEHSFTILKNFQICSNIKGEVLKSKQKTVFTMY